MSSRDPNTGLPVSVEWLQYNNISRNFMELSNEPTVLQETEEMLTKYRFWNHEFRDIALPPEQSKDNYLTWEFSQMDDESFELGNY